MYKYRYMTIYILGIRKMDDALTLSIDFNGQFAP